MNFYAHFAIFSFACVVVVSHTMGENVRTQQTQKEYDHARFAPQPDILRKYTAFVVSFDSKDDDNEDGVPDIRRVPEWVSQHIKRTTKSCIRTGQRPTEWFTDTDLYLSGVAPSDLSYKHSGFNRGHLAAKILTARISQQAELESHTVLNAVPQHSRFNQQPWKNLETITGAWAQTFCQIWVIQGPVFDTIPHSYIGDDDERRVAIPHALFKIVIRESNLKCSEKLPPIEKSQPEVLAFLYPQLGPGYYDSDVNKLNEFNRYLSSLSEIEKLTNLNFLPGVSKSVSNRVRKIKPSKVWEVAPPPDIKAYVRACPK